MHLPYMSPVPLSKVLQSNLQLQVNLLKKGNMFQYEVIPPDLSQVLVPSSEEILMTIKILTPRHYFTHPP